MFFLYLKANKVELSNTPSAGLFCSEKEKNNMEAVKKKMNTLREQAEKAKEREDQLFREVSEEKKSREQVRN